ncbi:cell wall-binding repeat-containing protein [Leifsonia sp. NPDC077715]|uniref:cell wall-binding repeat-containing protein n=1 Tax=Leifsonia sp. NPDC077715 TaxID=3155539 RepID=UPI00343EBDA3
MAFTAPAAAQTDRLDAPHLVGRLAGGDRFETSVAVSKAGHPGGAKVAYITSALGFADALSTAPAAVSRDGSLLLTQPWGIPAAVSAELTRLHPDRIVIVGGTAAVGPTVERALTEFTGAVERVSGADRFATSRALADTFTGPVDTVYLASGFDYPDALSAGAAAGAKGGPVMLIDPRSGALDAATKAVIRKLQPTSIAVVGGTAAIPESTVTQAKTLVTTVVRLGGSDRFETSAKVADTLPAGTTGYIASGLNFPDALVGSVIAGATKRPLYITQPTSLTCPIWYSMLDGGITDLTAIGGTRSLTDTATNPGCDALPPTDFSDFQSSN